MTRRPTRPGADGKPHARRWVPRSPPHRAGAIRQIESTRARMAGSGPKMCDLAHTHPFDVTRTLLSLECKNLPRGQPGSPDGPRQLVLAPRAGLGPYARGWVRCLPDRKSTRL